MLRKIKRIFKKKTYNYTKKFKSYDLAEKFLKKNKVYFDKRFITRFYGPEKVESLERFYAASIISALWKKRTLNILDIGGGNNPISSYIEKSTGKKTNCEVLETKRFAEIIQKKLPTKYKKKVRYINNLDQIKRKTDIVCFISSIQYLKDYEKIILKLKKYKPEYFIITRTFFHKNNYNFYSIEHGIPGSVHPYIFFSFHRLKNFFSRNGYNLIFQNNYNSNVFTHDSIDSKKFAHKDLVFKRK